LHRVEECGVNNGRMRARIAQQLVRNYSEYNLQGAFKLPVSDTLAARFAFNGEHSSSF
jgi:hypothetical protein